MYFIEVHHENTGEPVTVNISCIQMIHKNCIYIPGNKIRAKESYSDILTEIQKSLPITDRMMFPVQESN